MPIFAVPPVVTQYLEFLLAMLVGMCIFCAKKFLPPPGNFLGNRFLLLPKVVPRGGQGRASTRYKREYTIIGQRVL